MATYSFPSGGASPYQQKRTGSGVLLSETPVNQAGLTPRGALISAQRATGLGGSGFGFDSAGWSRDPRASQQTGQIGSYTVGPGGEVTYSVQTDPFQARLAQLSQMGLVGQAGNPQPRVQHEGIDEGREAAARDAAFGRAKDRAAMVAQSGLKSLKNIMAARGLQGSSIEAGGAAEILGGAAGQLGGLLREQAINEAGRAGDVADMQFQGDIAQRAQDIQATQALLSLINAAGAY